ncbi:hypothetical protein HK099_003322, partial [Clydaea vesicula]
MDELDKLLSDLQELTVDAKTISKQNSLQKVTLEKSLSNILNPVVEQNLILKKDASSSSLIFKKNLAEALYLKSNSSFNNSDFQKFNLANQFSTNFAALNGENNVILQKTENENEIMEGDNLTKKKTELKEEITEKKKELNVVEAELNKKKKTENLLIDLSPLLSSLCLSNSSSFSNINSEFNSPTSPFSGVNLTLTRKEIESSMKDSNSKVPGTSALKCDTCQLLIGNGPSLKAMGKVFHPEHFKCEVKLKSKMNNKLATKDGLCGRPLAGALYFESLDGKP